MGCGHEQPARFDKCPGCHMRGGAIDAVGSVVARSSGGGASRWVRLSEATAKRVERVRVPEPWQTALGGGMALRSSILVHGRPKAGKTTELLRLACSLPGSRYLPCEPGQDAGFLRMVAERDGLDPSELFVADGALELPPGEQFGYVLGALGEPPAPPLAVVDSLSVLGGEAEWEALRKACRGSVLACVMHVTKTGRMGGRNVLHHLADTVVRVTKTALVVRDNRFAAGPGQVTVKR